MLKIVATDMDGTLLNDKKEMPENTFEVIKQLHARGITFAVASGRQHFSLQKLYEEVKDDIVIISGNGGVIIDKGELIYSNPMDKQAVAKIIEFAFATPELKVNLCGLNATYMFENNVTNNMPMYLVESHFPKRVIIDNLEDVPADEEILQVAIFDDRFNSKENIYDKLKHLEGSCHLTISGSEWVDIVNKGVNKGAAIKILQDMLGATPEETMVFGDERNDYEMMQQAYYSYAMANAVDQIKEVSNFVAPTNEEAGVIRILENFLAMTASGS